VESNGRVAFRTSVKAKTMLRQLTQYGIYGRTVSEVARRMVEARLTEMMVADQRSVAVERKLFQNPSTGEIQRPRPIMRT
jgi:hypothetical protein